jgi:phosphopantetheine adenylyltransferase
MYESVVLELPFCFTDHPDVTGERDRVVREALSLASRQLIIFVHRCGSRDLPHEEFSAKLAVMYDSITASVAEAGFSPLYDATIVYECSDHSTTAISHLHRMLAIPHAEAYVVAGCEALNEGRLARLRSSLELPPLETIELQTNFPRVLLSAARESDEKASPAASSPHVPEPTVLRFADVVLGGTFDHVHAGHKVMLTVAALLSARSLLIGLSEQELLSKKNFAQALETFDQRRASLLALLPLLNPFIALRVVPIRDVYGPTATEEFDALVVSDETASGAATVNARRAENGLRPLAVVVVSLAMAATRAEKLSSTQLRQHCAAALAGEATMMRGEFLRVAAQAVAAANRSCAGDAGDAQEASLRAGAQEEAIAEMLQRLHEQFAEPVRAYHTREHIAALLRLWRRHTALLRRPDLVFWAIWFHDAV